MNQKYQHFIIFFNSTHQFIIFYVLSTKIIDREYKLLIFRGDIILTYDRDFMEYFSEDCPLFLKIRCSTLDKMDSSVAGA